MSKQNHSGSQDVSPFFPGQKHTLPTLPKFFPSCRSFFPMEAADVIIVHIITVCLWVPLRPPSEHALASTEASSAEPNRLRTHTKHWSQSGCCTESDEAVQVCIVCQFHLHIKIHCCLSVSSYSYGVLEVHKNTFTAGLSLQQSHTTRNIHRSNPDENSLMCSSQS